MFQRLKDKWKVDGFRLFLILCTFAIGGSLCGYVGRMLMDLLSLDKGVLWYIIYIIVVTILWPFSVLLISIFFGQFAFFRNYIGRMLKRMSMRK